MSQDDPTWGRTWGLGHAVRRFTLGSGPLRRGTDRVEVALRVLTLCVLLLAVPVGLGTGGSVHAGLTDEAARQRAQLSAVEATVVGRPRDGTGRSPSELVPVDATWTAPAGGRVTGRLQVEQDVQPGDAVTVWVERDGARRPAPLDDAQVRLQAGVLGGAASVAIVVVQFLLHAAGVWVLDRRRHRQWAAGWAAVGPDWRRHQLS
ncbi:Rv1733c family protein [Goekera deserti]